MRPIGRLREFLTRRRARLAVEAAEQQKLRRELDAVDRSLAEATHPPPPNFTGTPGGF